MFGKASLRRRFTLRGRKTTVGDLGSFRWATAFRIELLEQFAAAPDGARLNAIGLLAKRVVIGLMQG